MKQFINIVDSQICNYDGKCMLRDEDTGYAYCYGEKYGTEECPLFSNFIFVYFKDGKEMDNTPKF